MSFERHGGSRNQSRFLAQINRQVSEMFRFAEQLPHFVRRTNDQTSARASPRARLFALRGMLLRPAAAMLENRKRRDALSARYKLSDELLEPLQNRSRKVAVRRRDGYATAKTLATG